MDAWTELRRTRARRPVSRDEKRPSGDEAIETLWYYSGVSNGSYVHSCIAKVPVHKILESVHSACSFSRRSRARAACMARSRIAVRSLVPSSPPSSGAFSAAVSSRRLRPAPENAAGLGAAVFRVVSVLPSPPETGASPVRECGSSHTKQAPMAASRLTQNGIGAAPSRAARSAAKWLQLQVTRLYWEPGYCAQEGWRWL